MKPLRTLALLLLCLLVCVPTANARETERSGIWLAREFRHFRVYPRMDRGYRLYNQGRLDEARVCFDQVLAIDAKHTDARKMLLEISLKEGDSAGGDEQARLLSAQDPSSPFPHYYLARFASEKGDFVTAAAESRRALEKEGLSNEQEREMLTLLVSHDRKSGKAREIEAYLGNTCDPPSIPEAGQFCLKQRIDIYLINGDLKNAVAAYTKYEQQYGNAEESDIVYWTHLLEQQGDMENAYRVASRLPPTGPYLSMQVNLLNNLERYDEAAGLLEAYAGDEEKGTAGYWIQLATLHYHRGDVKAEFQSLSAGIRTVRDDAVLYEMLSDRLIALKQYGKAITVLEDQLALTGDDRTREKLAILHAAEKDYTAAIELTRQLVESTGEEEQRRHYLKQLVDYLAKDGDLEQIAAIYRAELEKGVDYHEFALPAGLTGTHHLAHKMAVLEAGYPYQKLPRKYRVELMIALATLYSHADKKAEAEGVLRRVSEEPELEPDELERMVSLAQAVDACPLVVTLSNRLVEEGTESVDSSLTAGYCHQKMGKPGLAVVSFQKALEAGPDPTVAHHIRKSLGYLYAELEQPEQALSQWGQCLEEAFEPELALKAAGVAMETGFEERGKPWLERVDPKGLAPEQRSLYWEIKARQAEDSGNHVAASTGYLIALAASEREELWYRYARNQMALDQFPQAEEALKQLIALSPDNARWHAELGYLYLQEGQLDEAVNAFGEAVTRQPDDCTLLESLAWVEVRRGNRDEAAELLRRTLACKEKALAGGNEDTSDETYRLKQAIGQLDQRWSVTGAASARLNDGASSRREPLVKNSGYSGFGSVETGWRPALFEFGQNRYMQVFGRLLWNTKGKGFEPDSDSLQGGGGLRLKPLADHSVFLTLEKLWAIGDEARDDWMGRLSASVSDGLGWQPSVDAWRYQNLYLDAAYIFDSETRYLTANYEWGRAWKLPWNRMDAALVPYLAGGGSYNNDNDAAKSDTLFDLGGGLSLFSWHVETEDRAHLLRNRLTLEGRVKIGGNNDETEALFVKWEVSY